ncbi:sigma-E processing peptidase SpoIIGA [Anaerocolumna sp. AGMB13025]|uniref:sigma-E processing peptidase SpoIIGA n=1 Tax=Anaerocolumna sp. AGMB13025 TaxID=3039116 RepID=UPI00241F9BB6|nr:sigma-E processing peptidase SpoIIGA [Anaerocolumna sp. AGMB13025]WFR54996.1 sigma-E processing peptidase SpoIIGA [Anaerocolumna sp. AGMB13025]
MNLYVEVYVDVIFSINFIMDILLLLIVKKILKCRSSILRMIGGAGTGALGACILAVNPKLNGFLQFLTSYVVICTAMILIAFGFTSLAAGIKAVIILYITTFFLGGVINSLYYHSMIGYYFEELIQGRLFQNRNMAFFILSAVAGGAAAVIFVITLKNLRSGELKTYETELSYGGKNIQIIGLLDTGNNLYDPIYGKPVIIAEFSSLEPLLSVNQRDLLCRVLDSLEGKHTTLQEIDHSPENGGISQNEAEEHFNIMMIPYHSIGKKNGMMPAIIMNRVKIVSGKEKMYSENVYTAVTRGNLSKEKKYQVILHRGIM